MPALVNTCSDPLIFPSPDEDEVHLVVGGVLASVATATEAYSILLESPGLMVRQPLARFRNPLALCDYHAEAAPYREMFHTSLIHHGRGAAGRPATKHAFMHALQVRAVEAMRDAPLLAAMPLAAEAYDAMRTDVSYVMAIARQAVSVLSKQHQWRIRAELRTVQQEAMTRCGHAAGEFTCDSKSACGTGDCPFASGIYAKVTAPAGPGKTARPANHSGGGLFSSDGAVADLERLQPFKVTSGL